MTRMRKGSKLGARSIRNAKKISPGVKARPKHVTPKPTRPVRPKTAPKKVTVGKVLKRAVPRVPKAHAMIGYAASTADRAGMALTKSRTGALQKYVNRGMLAPDAIRKIKSNQEADNILREMRRLDRDVKPLGGMSDSAWGFMKHQEMKLARMDRQTPSRRSTDKLSRTGLTPRQADLIIKRQKKLLSEGGEASDKQYLTLRNFGKLPDEMDLPMSKQDASKRIGAEVTRKYGKDSFTVRKMGQGFDDPWGVWSP